MKKGRKRVDLSVFTEEQILVALHSYKMHFAPLICRCYEFLYIRLPFNRCFGEVPKHSLFASQKKRDIGLSLLSSKDCYWGKM